MDTDRLTLDSPIFIVTAGQKLKKMHHFTELDVRNSEIYSLLCFFLCWNLWKYLRALDKTFPRASPFISYSLCVHTNPFLPT